MTVAGWQTPPCARGGGVHDPARVDAPEQLRGQASEQPGPVGADRARCRLRAYEQQPVAVRGGWMGSTRRSRPRRTPMLPRPRGSTSAGCAQTPHHPAGLGRAGAHGVFGTPSCATSVRLTDVAPVPVIGHGGPTVAFRSWRPVWGGNEAGSARDRVRERYSIRLFNIIAKICPGRSTCGNASVHARSGQRISWLAMPCDAEWECDLGEDAGVSAVHAGMRLSEDGGDRR